MTSFKRLFVRFLKVQVHAPFIDPQTNNKEFVMGRGDRRHSLKMSRIKEQNKKKDRIRRAMAAAKK